MEGSRSVRTPPYWFLGFGWVLLTLLLVAFVILLGIRQAKLDFIRRTEGLHDRLVQRVLSNEVVLAGFSAYFSVAEKTSFQEVRAYARTMLKQYSWIYQLEAQIRVAPPDLEAFEGRMRAAGYPDYKVRTFGYETDRRWHAVNARPCYYPIYFMEPLIPQATPVLGLDILSVPNFQRALASVFRTGRAAASPPFQTYPTSTTTAARGRVARSARRRSRLPSTTLPASSSSFLRSTTPTTEPDASTA